MFRMTREFYTPRHYAAKVTPKGVEAEIYLINAGDGNYQAMAFGGKRSKPDFHIRFRDQARRSEHVSNYIDNLKSRKEEKAERQAAKNAFEHTLKEGDILYSSWGYDQTNIDFYQVTKVVGKKSVKIRKIYSGIDHHDGCQSNYVVPMKDSFYENRGEYDRDGNEMLKRVQEGNIVSISSYANAYPWDGSPKRETDAYSGH